MNKVIKSLGLAVPLMTSSALAQPGDLPAGFVYLDAVAADIQQDLPYVGRDNFIGDPIDGYHASRIILTRQAAEALARVQRSLAPLGLGLKVYDGYRPQRAVDHFMRWAGNLGDQRMKPDYYPNLDKDRLVPEGYLLPRSGHSRGSTVDLTLVVREGDDWRELDMGTPFDFFDPSSWPASTLVSVQARANRLLLRTLMTGHGFQPLEEEWWHFTLVDEPFPDTYFDFPVQ